MKRTILVLLVVLSLVAFTGCTTTVEKITADDSHLDSTVRVSGTVQSPVKLGTLLGYTLVDKNDDKIIVSTDDLPDEGDKVTAKGTLKKGLLGIGYYIDTKE